MAGHAGDTGSTEPEAKPLVSHPLKLAQLPRAGGRGRAQDGAPRLVAGVSSERRVTNRNRGSTEGP